MILGGDYVFPQNLSRRVSRHSWNGCRVARELLLSAAGSRFLRGSGPRLEVRLRHGRQLLDECHDSPDFLVRHSDRAEAWHAGHLDTVFDYPEQLWRLPVLCVVLEIWRIGEHPFLKLGPFHAGSSVTVQAPARAKCASAGLHRRDIV